MTTQTFQSDLSRDFAMGIMLTFTKNEYKNDYTLDKIQRELINLYNEVNNSELHSFFFHCKAKEDNLLFYSRYDFSLFDHEGYNVDNYYKIIKNLLLEIKEENIGGFEEDYDRYLKEGKGFIWNFLSIFIFNFFKSYGLHISKYHKNSYLTWQSFDDRTYTKNYKLNIYHIRQKIDKVKKIFIKTKDKEKSIELIINSDNTSLQLKEKITEALYRLEKNETLHFIYENKEIILYKVGDNRSRVHCLKFTQKDNHHNLLPYIFNTKNYALLSDYIHLIDYKVYSEIRPVYQDKIKQFIEYSNKCNQIIFKSKVCSDVMRHIISPIINPMIEEMTDRGMYIGKRILKKVNKIVSSFFYDINDRNDQECIDFLSFLLDCMDEVNKELVEDKYKSLKKNIKTSIEKVILNIFLIPLGEAFLKKNTYILEVNIKKCKQFKLESDDQELHNLINEFERRYGN